MNATRSRTSSQCNSSCSSCETAVKLSGIADTATNTQTNPPGGSTVWGRGQISTIASLNCVNVYTIAIAYRRTSLVVIHLSTAWSRRRNQLTADSSGLRLGYNDSHGTRRSPLRVRRCPLQSIATISPPVYCASAAQTAPVMDWAIFLAFYVRSVL